MRVGAALVWLALAACFAFFYGPRSRLSPKDDQNIDIDAVTTNLRLTLIHSYQRQNPCSFIGIIAPWGANRTSIIGPIKEDSDRDIYDHRCGRWIELTDMALTPLCPFD